MQVQQQFGKPVEPVEPVQHALSLSTHLCEFEMQAHCEPVETVKARALQ